MSRYPWRDTSTDIAGGQPPQWETPQGAQVKADKALEESKAYTDEKTETFMDHVSDTTIHVTPADKTNWNSKAPGVHTHANATPTTPGFMSAEDKTKLNGVEAEANKYVHPATHPPSIIVQDTGNRFVSDAEKATWSAKAETTEATASTRGLMSASDKTKLIGITSGAEVNQNAFSQINDVVASNKSDNLFFVGGIGITITTDPVTKRLIVTATGDATPGAHASSHITGGTDIIPDAVSGGSSGLMSGSDAQFVRQNGETKIGAQAKADEALESAIGYTDQKVGEIVIDDASLTKKGIVMLSDVVTSIAKDKAATPSAVKLAYDEAAAAKQLGVERKAEVVATLNSIGVSASTSETWDQLIPKIAAVIRATGNATAAQVLAGSTFSNATANGITGTMVNRGTGGTVTPGTTDQVKAAGYYNSAITIKGDPNLIASNIKKNVPLYGLVGTAGTEFEPGDFSVYTRSTYTGQSNSSMRMVGGVTPSIGGTYRVSFYMTRGGGVSAWAEARIYVNGVPRGTLRTVVNTTYTEDITIKAGEEIQFWIRSGNAENYVYVQSVNLSILYSLTERST